MFKISRGLGERSNAKVWTMPYHALKILQKFVQIPMHTKINLSAKSACRECSPMDLCGGR